MILIHNTTNYRLGARRTEHPIIGVTVQLFQKFPQADHPHWQRIACLTLPREARVILGRLLTSPDGTGRLK